MSLQSAMVLAAGMGTRMRPLTDHTPKPLLEAGGRTLLDHTLQRLREVGIGHAVVNGHYLADQIEAHVSTIAEPEIAFSDERAELLETGGGVVKALPLLKGEAFVVINSDNLWLGEQALAPLIDAWDPARMDMLMLLVARESAVAYSRAGDFFMEGAASGPAPGPALLQRRGEAPSAPFVFTGAHVIKRSAFEGAEARPFSLNRIWDGVIARGRAFGIAHPGAWIDVGTPEGLAQANALLAREG
ncbi:MAG: nucleotidyltransferase family protein [Neomegalonema sp.]|nr:nucleotidyltransferase family protein [Neomegalonema sp.]